VIALPGSFNLNFIKTPPFIQINIMKTI